MEIGTIIIIALYLIAAKCRTDMIYSWLQFDKATYEVAINKTCALLNKKIETKKDFDDMHKYILSTGVYISGLISSIIFLPFIFIEELFSAFNHYFYEKSKKIHGEAVREQRFNATELKDFGPYSGICIFFDFNDDDFNYGIQGMSMDLYRKVAEDISIKGSAWGFAFIKTQIKTEATEEENNKKFEKQYEDITIDQLFPRKSGEATLGYCEKFKIKGNIELSNFSLEKKDKKKSMVYFKFNYNFINEKK
jgi:hypothetical protein